MYVFLSKDIYRVNQAEYVIGTLVAATQEYVNTYSTRSVGNPNPVVLVVTDSSSDSASHLCSARRQSAAALLAFPHAFRRGQLPPPHCHTQTLSLLRDSGG